MGQYYNVITIDDEGKTTVYDRTIDGNYTMPKLMEHSWWFNPFVNTMCHEIFHKPKKIGWIGDYADQDAYYHLVYETEKMEATEVSEAQVLLWEKYLVNHDTKQFLDCEKYYNACHDDNWCVHPLPLLVCSGNGRGGGDYRGENLDMVGIWYMNTISVECEKPEDYEEIIVTFKE